MCVSLKYLYFCMYILYILIFLMDMGTYYMHSLSVLGDVIKCLGETAKLKTPGHIPYRNSVLTMVLRNSLGGNSRTTMVAAVSPSSMDYEESLSTLKYAENAKKVRMRVAANVSSGLLASDGAASQLVPILQAEVKKLRELLQAQQQHTQQRVGSDEGDEAMQIVREMRARVEELEVQLQEREKLIQSLEQARTEESRASLNSSVSSIPSVDDIPGNSSRRVGLRSQPFVVLADDAIDTSLPRLINLNQDPLFSECLVYYIPEGTAVAGNAELDVDILLSGPDILSQHCVLRNEADSVCIAPASVDAKVYVNGELLQPPPNSTLEHTERFYLRHFDRISMGRYHLFRFEEKGRRRAVSPLKGAVAGGLSSSFTREAPGWDFAHDELMLNKDSVILAPRSRDQTTSSSNGVSNSGREGNRGDRRSPPRRDVQGYDSSMSRRKLHNRPSEDDRDQRVGTRKNGSDIVAGAVLSRHRSSQGVSTSRTVAEVVSANSIDEQSVKPPSLSTEIPAGGGSAEGVKLELATSPSDGEEWWEEVTKVAAGEVRVNTPSELRAMLRSVVESAERQFEEAERRRQVRNFTAYTATHVNELAEEDTVSGPSESLNQPSTEGNSSNGHDDSNGRGAHRTKHNAIRSVTTTSSDVPPPPPLPLSLEGHVTHPPDVGERVEPPSVPASSTVVSSGAKVSGGSAADILYAERRPAGAANRYSTRHVVTEDFPTGHKPSKEVVMTEERASSALTAANREVGRETKQTSEGEEGKTPIAAAPLVVTGAVTGRGVRFEDEASSLQQDMIKMQQKLRDRMQRYKA